MKFNSRLQIEVMAKTWSWIKLHWWRLKILCLQLHGRTDVQSTKKCKAGNQCADVNYGVLLLEFLELYGITFNYGWAGISVRNKGRYLKKTDGEITLFIEDPQCPGKHIVLIVQVNRFITIDRSLWFHTSGTILNVRYNLNNQASVYFYICKLESHRKGCNPAVSTT